MSGETAEFENARLSERVDELEIQLAHQNQLLDDLNGIVTEQARQIDRFSLHLGHLKDRVDLLEEPGPDAEGSDKPPHY